jgi:hypothetical protein
MILHNWLGKIVTKACSVSGHFTDSLVSHNRSFDATHSVLTISAVGTHSGFFS